MESEPAAGESMITSGEDVEVLHLPATVQTAQDLRAEVLFQDPGIPVASEDNKSFDVPAQVPSYTGTTLKNSGRKRPRSDPKKVVVQVPSAGDDAEEHPTAATDQRRTIRKKKYPPVKTTQAILGETFSKHANPTSALNEFSQKTKKKLSFKFEEVKDTASTGCFVVTIELDGLPLASARDTSKKLAKQNASHLAIEKLLADNAISSEPVSLPSGGPDIAESSANARVNETLPAKEQSVESVSKLHEYVDKKKLKLRWRELSGSRVNPPFTMAVEVNGVQYEAGLGQSKKLARRIAAGNALTALKLAGAGKLQEGTPNAGNSNSKASKIPDFVASAVCSRFSELLGADEQLRGDEVLTAFVQVHADTGESRVISLSHGRVGQPPVSEHPVLVARRAFLKALFGEVKQTLSGEHKPVLLEQAADPQLNRAAQAYDLYLYLSNPGLIDGTRVQLFCLLPFAVLEAWLLEMPAYQKCISLLLLLRNVGLKGVCLGRDPEEKELLDCAYFMAQIERALTDLNLEKGSLVPPDFLVQTSPMSVLGEPRHREGIEVVTYWAYGEDDLAMEDLNGNDALTEMPSSISFDRLFKDFDDVCATGQLSGDQKRRLKLCTEAQLRIAAAIRDDKPPVSQTALRKPNRFYTLTPRE
ncbi:hypothetical protein NDN08_006187 [Rhodosorus marinus]|uniref:DRBM domain-containing protein n=1 Tax=Rhodosorus marinus TaxID=101924 RepID=A0AAV8UNI6_9RHOD|nr:hypothetical protein NDN08_006187 [Rhodosorus marinus]